MHSSMWTNDLGPHFFTRFEKVGLDGVVFFVGFFEVFSRQRLQYNWKKVVV